MSDRVNLIDRKGVIAFDSFVTNKLNWIFREQPIVDLGIDAQIEQVANGNSTGKLIAIQIKTGLGNVSINKDKDFDYYISLTHYNYWLSYSIPVIIVLYDPDSDILYWNSIFKQNISKTKNGKYKITIKKEVICTENSKIDFDKIIALYQSKSFLNKDVAQFDIEELSNYCSDLFTCSSESLLQMAAYIERLDQTIKIATNEMEAFIETHKSGCAQGIVDKEVRRVAHKSITAFNICRVRIQNETPLIVNSLIEVFQTLELYLLPELDSSEFIEVKTYTLSEFINLSESINSLIKTLDLVVLFYSNPEHHWTHSLGDAQKLFCEVVQNHKFELVDLSCLTQSFIEKMETK